MKIAVIAANGRTGKEFLETALNHGHKIRAGVFGGHSLKLDKELELVECNATKLADIEKLIKGCDAVASFIGHGKKSPPTVQTDAIKNVIKASKKMGLKRIISLTGTGVRFPEDKITYIDKILNFSIYKIDPQRVNDGIAHAEVLKASNLDWTIIRVLKLTDANPGSFTLKSNGPTKILTPRKEVALACLQVLEEKSFIKEAPIISR